MPRISELALFASSEQNTLAVKQHCESPAQFPAFIGSSFRQLGEYLSELGELMTDIPYVAYDQKPGGGFIVKAGFTVLRPLPGKGDIIPGVIPEGKAVMCMYLGPYEDMEPTYMEIQAWCEARGLRQQGGMYEFYYNGPDTPPDTCLTKMLIPVE